MSKRVHHCSLAALSVELGGGAAPSEIRLLPAGRFRAADGSGRPEGIAAGWLIDDTIAARLVAAANARASDYVIDFEHQTLHAAANGQPAPAAGWYKRMEWRVGDGLYATDVRWTPRAAALIAGGEYRYFSPVFSYAASGAVVALGPAALTNNPGLDGLTDLAALSGQFAQFFTQEEIPMKELLKALGLSETATEAEALTALNALKTTHGTEVAVLKASIGQAPDPARYVEIAVLSATQAELGAAQTELVALKAEKHQSEVDKVVADARAAGKLSPALDAWARDLGKANLAALKAFVKDAAVIARPGVTQTGGKTPEGAAGGDAPGPHAVARAALQYQKEQAAAGIAVGTVAAVAHVTAGRD